MSSSSEGLLEQADNSQINRRKQHTDVFNVYRGESPECHYPLSQRGFDIHRSVFRAEEGGGEDVGHSFQSLGNDY